MCMFYFPLAQPMHWIYSPDRLKEVLSDLEPCPEFRPESANPFYRRATGEQTCYGDQEYVLLESLSRCGGIPISLKQNIIMSIKIVITTEPFLMHRQFIIRALSSDWIKGSQYIYYVLCPVFVQMLMWLT